MSTPHLPPVAIAPAFATPAPWRIWVRLFSGQRRRLAGAALVFLVKHSPAVLLPVITGLSIDLLAQRAPLSRIGLYALATAALIAQNLPGHRLYVRWLSQVVRSVESGLRTALAQRLQVLALPWWWRQSPAALQTKLLRDVESIGQTTVALAEGLLGSGSAIAVALVVTAWRAPQFLALFLLTVPLAASLVWATRRRLAAAQREHRLAMEALGDSAAEMARLLPLTRAHGLEQAQLARVGGHIAGAARTGLALDLAGGRFGALAWVGFQGLNAACLFVAAAAYASGRVAMTLGDVVLLSGFFASLTNAVLGLAGLVPQLHRGLEAVRSIDEVLRSAPVAPVGALSPAHLDGALSFEGVVYRHEPEVDADAGESPSAHAPALPREIDDAAESAEATRGLAAAAAAATQGSPGAGGGVDGIDLALAPGQLVALVGPSGSGKTTLALLACGLLQPQQGRLSVDGLDLALLHPQAWRRHVGWVPQEALLGDGTLRETLTFGLEAVPDERLHAVLDDTGCRAFVERLPQGLDTPLGHHGHRLSGGERQRLALARALLREPRLLVLDEPTSALDGQSELTVLAALARGRAQRTTLVIAHRLGTVADADLIVVMDGGRIVDRGRHEALLARCALYRRLWQPAGV